MNHNEEKKVGLLVPYKEVSWIIAGIVVIGFSMFCAGYFWGQRKAMAQFLCKVKEESFTDAITYGMHVFGQLPESDEETAQENTILQENHEPDPVTEQPTLQDDQSCLINKEDKVQITSAVRYAAPLIGFGTLSAAENFKERVKKNEISVIIKKRSSQTHSGKKIVWYQVVTQEYENKQELQVIIDKIKQVEKLKEVMIIEKKG